MRSLRIRKIPSVSSPRGHQGDIVTRITVKIGDRQVGEGAPCFISYEAGPTHSGLASAKELVRHASEAGADAVKFQIVEPDRLVADRKLPFSYDVLVDAAGGRTETVTEPLYDILCRRTLKESEWRELKAYSDSLGLAFFCTALFDDEIDFLASLGCQSIKIASADLNHYPLLRKVARTGLNIQLDTGNGSLGEMEAAVDIIRREGNENIIIHHCPSGYPARLQSINLLVITTLRQMFPYPIAYSDHTPGWDMDIAAVTLGASLVEKTITLDRTTRSVEHIMSLEPAQMTEFIKALRDLETALGSPRRVMHAEEVKKRQANRRSMYLKAAAKAGTPLSEVAIDFRRPGFGLGPEMFDTLAGQTLKTDLPAGHLLTLSDLR
jgi:N,N'-diacetyllegionaminate synthase